MNLQTSRAVCRENAEPYSVVVRARAGTGNLDDGWQLIVGRENSK
jgi:hypothetical protein